MKDFPVKVDNVSSLSAAEFNNYIDELENIIKDTGISLAEGDVHQIGKSIANYLAGGDYYTESGAANAYVCAAVGSKQAPTEYSNGMRVRFMVGNANTGASTINVNALGVKDIKRDDGSALTAGDLAQNDYVMLQFDSGNNYFVLLNSKAQRSLPVLIQDYTQVKNVGDALQQAAGFDYSLSDLNTLLVTASSVLAYYRFASGALTTDENATYTLTNNNGATNTTGILATNFATNLVEASSQYYTQATLLDSPSTLSNGLFIAAWMKFNDGQPVANINPFFKENIAGTDRLFFRLNSNGTFDVVARTSGTVYTVSSAKIFDNGVNPWVFVCMGWDSTNGLRLWIDGVLESVDASATTLMSDGTSTDLFIGSNTVPSNFFDGKIAHFMVLDIVATQRDVDLLYSVPVAIPVLLQGADFDVQAKKQVLGDTSFVQDVNFPVVRSSSTKAFRKGNNVEHDSTDKIKLIGRL